LLYELLDLLRLGQIKPPRVAECQMRKSTGLVPIAFVSPQQSRERLFRARNEKIARGT
jgi:hypothetical protein